MDAEEYRVMVSEFRSPRDLSLTELVEEIGVNERFLGKYETHKIFLKRLTFRDLSPEDESKIDTAKTRLKLLYDEVQHRDKNY